MEETHRSRRRRQVAEAVQPAPLVWDRDAWRHVVVFSVFLAALVAAGLLVQRSVQVTPSGALARCHLARQLAPRTFLGMPAMCIDTNRSYTADILTTRGKVTIALLPRTDPQTVNNFVVLAANGFYDGLTFWRVEGWNVQAGDPLGNGRGGPGYYLPDEPSSGHWSAGAVGMAREPNGPVNGSQFFILKDVWPGGGPPHGATYNRFGTVTRGLDLLAALTAGDHIISVTIRAS